MVSCTNQGAPGIDGQDFAEVEAYELERWLGELAQALGEKSATDRRRSGASGKLRPLGISTWRA